MGYSCTARAHRTLERLAALLQERYPLVDPHAGTLSNGWTYRRRRFVWEIGREQPDGAITGSVIELAPLGERLDGAGKRVGTFRIEPDGRIARFPYVPTCAYKNEEV